MAKKSVKKSRLQPSSRKKPTRKHRITLCLNDEEKDAIEQYCKKHKIKHKSTFIREFVLVQVVGSLLKEPQALYGKEELNRMLIDFKDDKEQ